MHKGVMHFAQNSYNSTNHVPNTRHKAKTPNNKENPLLTQSGLERIFLVLNYFNIFVRSAVLFSLSKNSFILYNASIFLHLLGNDISYRIV